MRALTVQQPWGWCILNGGKSPENRTQVWGYRGPLVIHAGKRWSDRGAASPLVRRAVWDYYGTDAPLIEHERWWSRESPGVLGAFIGVVELVDVHQDTGACCMDSPWAERSYAAHGGKTVREVTHLVLERPRVFTDPIPARGHLGLWVPKPVDQELIDLAILSSKPGVSVPWDDGDSSYWQSMVDDGWDEDLELDATGRVRTVDTIPDPDGRFS